MSEKEHIVDFISASVQEKPVAAMNAFSAAIEDRIASKLDDIEMTVRDEMFSESVKLTFETNKFVASHGREPKGRGRWIFAEKKGSGTGDEIEVPSTMTYQEAKKWVKKKLTDEGVSGSFTVMVLP